MDERGFCDVFRVSCPEVSGSMQNPAITMTGRNQDQITIKPWYCPHQHTVRPAEDHRANAELRLAGWAVRLRDLRLGSLRAYGAKKREQQASLHHALQFRVRGRTTPAYRQPPQSAAGGRPRDRAADIASGLSLPDAPIGRVALRDGHVTRSINND